MDSEARERRHRFGKGLNRSEEVFWLKTVSRDEDRVLLNGDPYLLTRSTRFRDERDRRIGLKDLHAGVEVVCRYETGPKLEGRPVDKGVRVLREIIILRRPERTPPDASR